MCYLNEHECAELFIFKIGLSYSSLIRTCELGLVHIINIKL